MKSVTTSKFRKLRDRLPNKIQAKADEIYRQWQVDSSHPSLQFKKLNLNLPIYSIRMTLHYRALGRLENETIIWFWIGSHNDYDQLISSIK